MSFVLGHCLIYMIILNDHVLGTKLDTWMPSTLCGGMVHMVE